MAPVSTQTSMSPPGPHAFTCRLMSEETMKMPEPIIVPTTSEMAWMGPMPRMNLCSPAGGAAGGSTVVVM